MYGLSYIIIRTLHTLNVTTVLTKKKTKAWQHGLANSVTWQLDCMDQHQAMMTSDEWPWFSFLYQDQVTASLESCG